MVRLPVIGSVVQDRAGKPWGDDRGRPGERMLFLLRAYDRQRGQGG